MIEIRQLKMVKEIAACRSITKAAANLFLTQSAVSQQLKLLEQHLGIPLFSRDNKVMSVNEFGLKLLETADLIDTQLKKLDLDIRSMQKGFKHTLAFSTECYTSYSWISDFLNSLDDSIKSKFELIVLSEYTRNPIPHLLSGELDFAIVTSRYEPKQLEYVRLFDDELVAICSARHKWKSKTNVYPADFSTEHFFEYNTDKKNLDAYKHFFEPARKYPRFSTKN